MGYLKIPNLYQDRRVLEFKRVYALEKIHGTSAHVAYQTGEPIRFSAGAAKHATFVDVFDPDLPAAFERLGLERVVVYGEAYGGKQQRMRDVYGDRLRFVGFDVRVGDLWLDVPNAHDVCKQLGLEFVDWELVPTDLPALNLQRDRVSVQAVRNGCGSGKRREGVVLRPPFEVTLNDGDRLIAKHKAEEFRETASPRPVDEAQLKVLRDAEGVADEWVTEMRLTHVLDAFPDAGIERTRDVIQAMLRDVEAEAGAEVEWSREARKAVSTRAAQLFKRRLVRALEDEA